MKIKYTTLIFLITIIYCLCSCGGDSSLMEELPVIEPTPEEEIVEINIYPKKYIYTGLAFNPTEFYRYKSPTEFEQFIPETGELLLADSTFEYEYTADDGLAIIPLKEVELLSDTLLRMLWEGEGISSDTTYSYTVGMEQLEVDFFGSTIVLLQAEENKQLKICTQFYAFNYFDTIRDKRDYSPFDGGACYATNTQDILEQIVQEELNRATNLQLNDTLLVKITDHIMELEE